MSLFKAKIAIIGINPYILLPPAILSSIFKAAARDKGPIPVHGRINGKPFIQTLVRYAGAWRLYVNQAMLSAGKAKLGATARFTVAFDPKPRLTPLHPALKRALAASPKAAAAFKALAPSRQKEIKRYINNMKTPASVQRNVATIVSHLAGKPAKGLSSVLRTY